MTDPRGDVVDQTVEVMIDIAAPADAVFDYFVVPEKLLSWLGVEGTIDPRPGGEIRIVIGDDDTAIGSYLELDRPNHVVFTWGWLGSDLVPPGASTVDITLTEKDDLTLVTLVHSGLPEGQDTAHLEGWLYFLGRFDAAVPQSPA